MCNGLFLASLERRPLKGFLRGEHIFEEKSTIFLQKYARPNRFFSHMPFEQAEKVIYFFFLKSPFCHDWKNCCHDNGLKIFIGGA
jgi:hypothetical protein